VLYLATLAFVVGCDNGTTATSVATTPTTTSTSTSTTTSTPTTTTTPTGRRVPAEWEPQEAVWLQWPRNYERSYESAFAKIVATTVNYEDTHILVHDEATKVSAENALSTIGALSGDVINGDPTEAGFKIIWHDVPNDNAWMRDNGPVYIEVNGEMRIQDWIFDGWGGAFGDFPVFDDDAIPIYVGEFTKLAVDTVDIVHERGNLEFNGSDTVILNWSVLGDPNRNPGLTKASATKSLKTLFGVENVVYIEGVPSGDLTKGHVDGIARFIDKKRVVVADCGPDSACTQDGPDDQVYDNAASIISDAGFEVIRWVFPGSATYSGATFDIDYMNWIVGNGFVITVGFDNPATDAAAKVQLEEWFPGRDVYVIEMLDSWYNGGGVHCHTNDQPALPAQP
jgi:agmatine deiminase